MRKRKFLFKKGIYQNPITILKFIYSVTIHSPNMYRKQCRFFFLKMHFFGSEIKKKKYSMQKIDFLFVKYFCQIPHQKLSVLSFFIQCIPLRYAENNPQKHLQSCAYFRGEHFAKIKELCQKKKRKKKKKKKRNLPWYVFIEVLLQTLSSFLLLFIRVKNLKNATGQNAFITETSPYKSNPRFAPNI